MRFANSPEMSSCLKDGTSPVFDIETVGNASSSLTPGSSTTSVAGKNRFPTISCARASVVDATGKNRRTSGELCVYHASIMPHDIDRPQNIKSPQWLQTSDERFGRDEWCSRAAQGAVIAWGGRHRTV